MSQNLIDYEIVLLLAKYGEKEVLSAFARNLGLSSNEIESRMQGLKQLKRKTATRKRADPSRIIESLVVQHPEKADHLKTLFSRFQSKTFLPELKDVRRFFDRHSTDLAHPKSRVDAVPSLFKLLASLDLPELTSLCQKPEPTEYSSLGLISQEIMRRGK
jgi:hypothetical protein